MLQKVFSADPSYISTDGKEWMCQTCNRALNRESMLNELNALELRLIYLQVPFIKMVALPSGIQWSIHGPAVIMSLQKSIPFVMCFRVSLPKLNWFHSSLIIK